MTIYTVTQTVLDNFHSVTDSKVQRNLGQAPAKTYI